MRPVWSLIFCIAMSTLSVRHSDAQTVPYERTFSQSKAAVEKTVKQLQPSASGRLPVLDGFASPWISAHPCGTVLYLEDAETG